MIEHEIHILEQFLKNEDCWKFSFAITEEKKHLHANFRTVFTAILFE